ncbi:MAG: hypothetical protein Aurels2KO_02440 [Aureliella sp.]
MRVLVVESDMDQRLAFLNLLESYCARSDCSWASTTLPVQGSNRVVEPTASRVFEVTFVKTCGEAVEKACDAASRSRPFEVAFVRFERHAELEFSQTVSALWRVDNDIHTIGVASSQGCDWPAVSRRLGESDRLFLQFAPLNADATCQLMMSLSAKRQGNIAQRRALRDAESANLDLQAELGQVKFSEHQLAHAAVHDGLTGLPNREFIKQLVADCADADNTGTTKTALMFLDVDNFKNVNDSLGHRVGDQLLIEFSNRLKEVSKYRGGESAEQSTYVARLGGDEFVLLAKGLSSSEEAERIALSLQDHVTQQYMLGGNEINIGVSIGITFFGEGIDAADQLMHNADLAMYRAKFGGKQCVAVYDETMHRMAARRLYLENALRTALRDSQLSVVHQPMYRLSDRKLMALESLLRWTLPDGTAVSPSEFIPIAEDTGLILPIGEWVIEEACKTIRDVNRGTAKDDGSVWVSVNVAQRQLSTPGFARRVEEILRHFEIDGSSLCVEVTEETILAESSEVRENIDALRAMNIRVFLDDFGTGHSSLNCLHKLPIDVVKVDRSFVSTMEANPDYECIVSAIITLAHSFGATVVAEGIESDVHVEQLKVLECDWGQGYLYARPMVSGDLKQLIADSRNGTGIPPLALDVNLEQQFPTEQNL